MSIVLDNSNFVAIPNPLKTLPQSKDPTVVVMIYGAIQAYEFDQAAGLTDEMSTAKAFLLKLESQYSFTDQYAQKTLDDFCSLANSGGDVKTWWDGLKTNGLVSTDSTQPKVQLNTWIESNTSNFNPFNLPGDDYLNRTNYTLYSDMFFMELEKESGTPSSLKTFADNYFTATPNSSANAGALALQIYNSCGQPEPGEGNWSQFQTEIANLLNALDSTPQKGGMYLALRAFSMGICPDPYTSMGSFFAAVQNGTVSPTTAPWTILGSYEDSLYQSVIADYKKFEADLNTKDGTAAAVQDYEKIRNDQLSQDSTYLPTETSLKAAADTWANSIQISTLLIDNSGDGGGDKYDGATGNIGGTILDSNGNAITLAEYLNNPSLANCHVNLPEFCYRLDGHTGTLNKTVGGALIHDMWAFIHDSSFFDSLNGSFSNISWADTNSNHGYFDLVATGSLSDLMNQGQSGFFDSSSGASATSSAATAIENILASAPS